MRAADVIERLAANLGANLRYVRRQRGLTQDQVARLCGVPRSTVSHLETGAANPTLSVLAQVAMALQLPIEELVSTPRARLQIFPRGSLPVEVRGSGHQARVQSLLPDPIPGMTIDRIELPAGVRMPGIPHRPGTREYLACERGRLTLWAAGESMPLSPADVVAFQGDQPHSYHNEGREVAVGFSVVTLAPVGAAPLRE